jgi:hypothetical protein
MPLKIKIGKEAPPQATVELQVRKTLDGNLLITDHLKMDIVIVPKDNKIVSFPKPNAGDGVYDYQRDLMNSLFQGGVVNLESVQGGAAYGMLEGVMGEGSGVDPVQVALLEIEKFIKRTMADDVEADAYDEYIEDRFTDPTAEDSTEWGEIPPEQDEPYRQSLGQSNYSFAGYGYLY